MIVRPPVTRIIMFIMIARCLVSKMNPGHSGSETTVKHLGTTVTVRRLYSRITSDRLRAEILSVWRIK